MTSGNGVPQRPSNVGMRGVFFKISTMLRRMQVVVLVGTGWSYMTPFLRDREKRILMVVIPLQVTSRSHLGNLHCPTPWQAMPEATQQWARDGHVTGCREITDASPHRCALRWRSSSWTRTPRRRGPGSPGATFCTWWTSSAAAPSCSPSSGPSSTYGRLLGCAPSLILYLGF